MEFNITARLLFAARQAYQVAADGTVGPTFGSDQIGYVSGPAGFVSGPALINAATLGACPDGIILAFRGTLPPQSPDTPQVILDWLNDIDALLVPDAAYPGLVHQGFRDSLDELWHSVSAALADLRAQPGNAGLLLYITGHSKGGALAMLAAWRLWPANVGNIFVSTYAAARCGDQDFVDAYNDKVPHSARFEFQDDIVPHLPPTAAFVSFLQNVPALKEALKRGSRGYVSVAELHFINWSDVIVAESPLLEPERLWHLFQRMTTFQFDVIAAEHSIGPRSGYANALTGGA